MDLPQTPLPDSPVLENEEAGNFLLLREGTSPFAPAALLSLFFKPRDFFVSGRAFNATAYLLIGAWILGTVAAEGRFASEFFKHRVGVASTSVPGTLGSVWTYYWAFVLLLGIVWALWSWFVQGWWYSVRLRWSGATAVPRRAARILFLYTSLITAAPLLLIMLIDTIVFPNYAAAFDGAPPWHAFLMIAPFWSYVASYRAVTGVFALKRGRALLWFLLLPSAFTLFAGVIVVFLARLFA